MMRFESSKVKYFIVSTALLAIIFVLLVITSSTAKAEQNPPPIGGGDSTGDWVIENGDTILRENQEIRLKGNLYIEDGGNLTFKNVTLKMNSSTDGEFKIEVKSGGEFYIYDNDNNKETTYDASVITAYSTSYEYLFHVKDGAKMIMKNSELHECGPGGVGQWEKWGMIIWSSDVLIENNDISYNFKGIYCKEDASPKIINNTFSYQDSVGIYLQDNSSPLIENNVINGIHSSGRRPGISCGGTTSPTIINNFISSASNGLGIYGSVNCTVINTTIKDNKYGIYTYNTDSAKITLINSSFKDNSEKDIWFNDDGDINIIVKNITSGLIRKRFKEGSKAELHIYYFLHVKVIDDEDKPVQNAIIRVRDNDKGDYDENFTTDKDGWKRWILLLERISKDGGGTGYSPFRIDASKDGRQVSVDDLIFGDYYKSKELILKLDFKPPEISNIQTKDITEDSITITWETNEESTSRVEYGNTSAYGFEELDETMVTSHSITLTDLESDTTYHFRVNSTDSFGNSNQSIDFEFKTLDIIPPEIYNVKNSTPTENSVIITWNTNEPSNSTVEYGLNESYGNMESKGGFVTFHTITLTDLFPDTIYHFRVNSTDAHNNSNQSQDFTFKTLDTIPPKITNVKNETPTGTSVIITWTTNEPSDSLVNYGLDDNYGFFEYDASLTNFHSITLTNLKSETLYHFSVNSTDASGNSNQSIDFTFETLDITAPEISNIDYKQITKNSAKIIWTTNEPSDSRVLFGKTISYGLEKYNQDLVTSHTIDLSGLEPDMEYHFCVNSSDEEGNSNQSNDFSFSTKPEIIDIEPPENPTFSPENSEIVILKRPKITITFSEEVIVTEAKLNDLNITEDLESTDYFIYNYTPLTDLPIGENTISVKAKDLNGNEMNQPAICTFIIEISEIDKTPPEISEIKSIEITQNSVTITWQTNEKSTSQIEYGTSDSYGKETTKDENLVTSHSIKITGLEPSTTYHFRVISIDEAGNENISKDYNFKTLETSEEINIDVKLEIDITEPKEGETINISAKVTNHGKTSIEISIIFYENNKIIAEKKISIAPGKTENTFCNWKAEGKGTHEIKVVIMCDGEEIKNITDSKNIEVKEVADNDSGFNMIYLISIIIIPIVIVIGLVMRNRGMSQKQKQSLPTQQQQIYQETSQIINKQPTTQPAFKICPFCNAQVPSEFKFCNMCGKQIGS